MNGYQRKRVVALLDAEDKLSDWEWDFINSLADREDDYVLSEKQNATLNKIAGRVGV